ncbi:hypothetical protein [Asticcacaulis excentricus]|uniref:PepSY domain-containing protein n=1 Tax=Asticcacaulis excentricus (strain ATCC 15261 / DSM 4724 / KCTC 12464 / NCIMB 9791 / VKM B-1370 / CB 48) TaxID=573065 RepID=E8RLD8_ASTEC|nr:hypothetical protein [Asticcacaulis excentricus]ADU13682.1 hypothetical protein Astex_2020 [Asticcacaulis excentricus CB 48]
MKPILTLSALLLIGLPLAAEARERAPFGWPQAHEEVRQTTLRPEARPRFDEPERLTVQQRYSIDDAITLVEQRTGGRYVSGNQTGPSTFVIKVQIGPNIVTYRVDLANRSMSKM